MWYNKDMNKQTSLSGLRDELAQVRTKKKEFLTQMDRIIPWGEWVGIVQPCYYKGERGNKPYDLELMLRLYVLQNLYNLSDEGTVAEAMDSRAASEFCGVESSNQVPDGDTLGRFRNLLLKHGLQEKLFAQVVELLQKRGLLLKKGTIVNSTLISAPSSTKNQEKKRDPDAHSVKKGNTWNFGYKAHVGVDKDSGLVHTIKGTSANVHDVTMVPELLTGEEETVYGDSGYLGAEKREDAVVGNHQGKAAPLQDQPPSIPEQARLHTIQSTDQAPRTGEIICTGQGRTRLCGSKKSASLPKNTIPRAAKTDRKTEYHVRTGESDPG